MFLVGITALGRIIQQGIAEIFVEDLRGDQESDAQEIQERKIADAQKQTETKNDLLGKIEQIVAETEQNRQTFSNKRECLLNEIDKMEAKKIQLKERFEDEMRSLNNELEECKEFELQRLVARYLISIAEEETSEKPNEPESINYQKSEDLPRSKPQRKKRERNRKKKTCLEAVTEPKEEKDELEKAKEFEDQKKHQSDPIEETKQEEEEKTQKKKRTRRRMTHSGKFARGRKRRSKKSSSGETMHCNSCSNRC